MLVGSEVHQAGVVLHIENIKNIQILRNIRIFEYLDAIGVGVGGGQVGVGGFHHGSGVLGAREGGGEEERGEEGLWQSCFFILNPFFLFLKSCGNHVFHF